MAGARLGQSTEFQCSGLENREKRARFQHCSRRVNVGARAGGRLYHW